MDDLNKYLVLLAPTGKAAKESKKPVFMPPIHKVFEVE